MTTASRITAAVAVLLVPALIAATRQAPAPTMWNYDYTLTAIGDNLNPALAAAKSKGEAGWEMVDCSVVPYTGRGATSALLCYFKRPLR